MSELSDNMVVSASKIVNVGDVVKCRTVGGDASAQSGRTASRGIVAGEIEQADIEIERKKKTRRRKAKRKNPYQKNGVDNRGKKNMRLRDKAVYEQPVAPYNSNRFLIEDHNDLQDFDVKLMEAASRNGESKDGLLGPTRTGRVRDASFTSAESDDDFFYSSPEDEEEFLSKEFSNTYRDLHVESLANMSKPELIQTILQLEEKVDSLQKRLDSESEAAEGGASSSPDPSSAQFQTEISKLALAHQRGTVENERLANDGAASSSSSEDSESDSSSSSSDGSVRDDEEMPQIQLVNGQLSSPPLPDNT